MLKILIVACLLHLAYSDISAQVNTTYYQLQNTVDKLFRDIGSSVRGSAVDEYFTTLLSGATIYYLTKCPIRSLIAAGIPFFLPTARAGGCWFFSTAGIYYFKGTFNLLHLLLFAAFIYTYTIGPLH